MEAEVAEQLIDFDGQQIVVRSNDPDIRDFVSQTYGEMLAPRTTTIVGVLDIHRNEDEYFLRAQDGANYSGDLVSISRHLRRQIHLRFIGTRADLIWLHAGAVVRDNRCTLIVAPTGHGKSSLVTMMCQRGWQMLSDDLAPVRIDTLEVLPFPERPVRRIYPGRHLQPEEMGLLQRESVDVASVSIRRLPAAINRVVLPVFRGGDTNEFVRLSPGEVALELARNCTNLAAQKAVAVAIASKLAVSVEGHRLFYGNASDAGKLLDAF